MLQFISLKELSTLCGQFDLTNAQIEFYFYNILKKCIMYIFSYKNSNVHYNNDENVSIIYAVKKYIKYFIIYHLNIFEKNYLCDSIRIKTN